MRTTYYDEDDILVIHLSDKAVCRDGFARLEHAYQLRGGWLYTRRLAETCQENDLNINTQNPRPRINKHPQVRCHHVIVLLSIRRLSTTSSPADAKVSSCLRA